MKSLKNKRVHLPSSELYKAHGPGTVVREWSNMIEVLFDNGSIGHYTLPKHGDIKVEE